MCFTVEGKMKLLLGGSSRLKARKNIGPLAERAQRQKRDRKKDRSRYQTDEWLIDSPEAKEAGRCIMMVN